MTETQSNSSKRLHSQTKQRNQLIRNIDVGDVHEGTPQTTFSEKVLLRLIQYQTIMSDIETIFTSTIFTNFYSIRKPPAQQNRFQDEIEASFYYAPGLDH